MDKDGSMASHSLEGELRRQRGEGYWSDKGHGNFRRKWAQ